MKLGMISGLTNLRWANDLTMAAKMYLVFLLIYFSRISHHSFFVGFAFIVLYALIVKDFIKKPIFWIMIALAILPGLWVKFYQAGNHVFLLVYLAFLFFIAHYFSKLKEYVALINAKILLALIMGFAILQKMLSEVFLNGSSLIFLNANGGFFTHFQRFFPIDQAILKKNQELILEQTSSLSNLSTSIELSSPNWLFDFDAALLVYIILGTEVVFLILLFVKNQWLRNGFFILFLTSLVIIRIETGFASLLCILLFLQAQRDHFYIKLIYLAVFSLLISLILSKLGAY